MRTALLLLVAVAAPADAKPMPALVELPPIAAERRALRAPQVMVITPGTTRHKQPVLDEPARAALHRRVTSTTGAERLAALDALTASLEELDVADAEVDLAMAQVDTYYAMVLAEPGLEAYAYADELIVRAASSAMMTDPPLATRWFERVLVRFPKSPFVFDVRLALAKLAQSKQDFAAANRQYDEILAAEVGLRARYARLQRAWLNHEAKDYKRAVADLAQLLAEPADPLLGDAAADSIIAPYAHAGRADFAATLFDHVDRAQSPRRLRQLAGEYDAAKKPRDVVIVLRAAIERDRDRDAICRDRVEIVSAMAGVKNRIEVELAIAELAAAVKIADPGCAAAADEVVSDLAFAWHHTRGVTRAQAARLWTRAAELATTAPRREAALKNAALARTQRAAR